MYHPTVIQRNVERLERSANVKLVCYDIPYVESVIEHLDSIYDPVEEKPKRALSRDEVAFIKNEQLLSLLDWRYWAERYATIQRDGGGICKFHPWGAQEIFLRRIAERELQTYDAALRKEPVDGLFIVAHKARQLGATALGRVLTMHRLTLNAQQRAMAASVDDDKKLELYDRDKLLLDSLPWWMKPSLRYDEKGSHIHFEQLNSRVLYQTSLQRGGLGVSRQFDLAHLTECSTWEHADRIELDFVPTLPQSATTLAIFESTAYGRGNWWHEFVINIRRGVSRRWMLVFIPWYAELTKYRAQPPLDWKPSEVALRHAMKVYETSPEYVGKAVMLPRENLYWWETTRAEYQAKGTLNFFLTNWCATIEESFQHSTRSAFSPELLDELRTRTQVGESYEIRTGAAT